MTESPELTALLNAVERLLNEAMWYPADSFGTPETIVSTEYVTLLRTAYDAYCEQEASACA